MGYLFSQSASCQLAMSKHKSYCVSFNLKAVETAEKKSKEAAAREFGMREVPYNNIYFKCRPRLNAGLVLTLGQNLREGNKCQGNMVCIYMW